MYKGKPFLHATTILLRNFGANLSTIPQRSTISVNKCVIFSKDRPTFCRITLLKHKNKQKHRTYKYSLLRSYLYVNFFGNDGTLVVSSRNGRRKRMQQLLIRYQRCLEARFSTYCQHHTKRRHKKKTNSYGNIQATLLWFYTHETVLESQRASSQ